MDHTEEMTPSSPDIRLTKIPDYKTIYSNWVQATFSPFEIGIVVGHAVATANNIFDVEVSARVVFHPAEAKIVADMLLQSVANYEAQFGPLTDVSKHVLRSDAQSEDVKGAA